MSNQLDVIQKAAVLIEERKYLKAKEILNTFIKNNKTSKIDIKFFYTLYLVSDRLREFQNAKKYLEKCLKINANNHIVLNNLGNIFYREGNTTKAEKFYLQSYNLKENYLIVVLNLAILYQNLGNFKKAKEYYFKAIKLSPKQLSIYYNLSRIDRDYIDDDKISFIKNILDKEKIGDLEKSYGFFILAEYEKKRKDFSKEVKNLIKAHEFVFNSNKKNNLKALDYWKKIIPKIYNKFTFNNDEVQGELNEFKPIFIIGLPRSGSTVIEALLSSGKLKITSLGESSIFNGIVAREFSPKNKNLIDLNLVIDQILKTYSEKNYNLKNKIFIDKSLENFFYIDIIVKVFPNAQFINSIRNIEDNIFAIFKQSLSKISWTHSLENILEYTDNYLKVMNYFSKKYPKKILTINLEELTNNLELISKKIYSFCNLEWSEEILKFSDRKDLLISTASNIQIRENIKKYENNKYKPYKKYIDIYKNKYPWLN